MESDNLIYCICNIGDDSLFLFDKSSRSFSFDEMVFYELESSLEAAFTEVGSE